MKIRLILTDEETVLPQLDALFGFALRLTRDPQQAEDLVQDTYARAFAGRASILEDAEQPPYLFSTTSNVWR